MNEPTWWAYFRRTAGTETGRVIAEAAKVSEPQVSRWKSGKNRPDADALVRFARHYERPPTEALVAAGYLSPDEADEVIEVAMSTGDLAVDDLIEEMRRRIGTAEAQSAFIDALTQGAAIWIGEAPHSPGVSVTRVGDQVTANLVLTSDNELRIQPGLAARTQGEPNDLTTKPPTTGSASEANPHEKTGAADRRDDVDNDGDLIGKDQVDSPDDYELDRRRHHKDRYRPGPIDTGAAAYDPPGPSDADEFNDGAGEGPDPEGPEGGA
ncbi:immunity repressor [Gordonia phage Malisha]|nr:immunity repressor [Gordonia phage Malisha]